MGKPEEFIFKVSRGKERVKISLHINREKTAYSMEMYGSEKFIQDLRQWANEKGYFSKDNEILNPNDFQIGLFEDFKLRTGAIQTSKRIIQKGS